MFAEVENCGEFQSGGSDSHLISTQDSTTHIVTCDVGHKTCKDLGHYWYFPGYLSSGCCHCDAGCDHSLETGTDCATKYRTATGHGDELTRAPTVTSHPTHKPTASHKPTPAPTTVPIDAAAATTVGFLAAGAAGAAALL